MEQFLEAGIGIAAVTKNDLAPDSPEPKAWRNGPPVFVLSLKAGGTGSNLVNTNHVRFGWPNTSGYSAVASGLSGAGTVDTAEVSIRPILLGGGVPLAPHLSRWVGFPS